MSFPLHIYLLTALAACICSAASLPLWRKFCIRFELVDDPGHRKIHEQTVPLAGGLAVFSGLVLPIVAGFLVVKFQLLNPETTSVLNYGFNKRALQLAVIFGGAAGMLLLGIADDRFELPPAVKFTGQFLVAFAVAASGVRITLFVENLVFSYAITIFWILTVVNAFNFMDNMNGLCAGLGAIASFYFATAAALKGQYLVALLALLVAGALVGFLPFNFPKASAFLGDAGSHLVGFLMAVLAILPHFYTEKFPNKMAVLSPLLILAVPLADLAWVVLLRWMMGKPFYIGDTNHLSHRFVRRGMSRSQAVLLIWFLAAASGAITLF